MKVLIVGAGPTGLTAGIELCRLGVVPTIVDRRETASTLSRAVGVTPRSLSLLKPSGVTEKLLQEAIPFHGIRIHHGTSLSLDLPLRSERMAYPYVIGMPQDRTEALMAETLELLGGSIQFGKGFEGYEEEGGKAAVTFADGTSGKFDVVIGADGIRSTVREAAGIEYPGFDLEQTWSIADVDAEGWEHPDKITLVQAGPGMIVVFAPLEARRYRLVSSAPNALEAMPLPINVTNIRRQGQFKISVRQASTYSKGPVHLAGDAAHCHAPVGGRGMNLGIADAAELAERLVNGGIEDYSGLRHRLGNEAVRITERGRKMTGGVNLPRRVAFRTLIGAANYVPAIKRRLGRFLVEF
ncbi:MAG: FAD-dependent monooxygenase [Rhodobacteraceae bacterium]|nr:FAD-dependent monooxygenase [Paracoccaceae bacterium]